MDYVLNFINEIYKKNNIEYLNYYISSEQRNNLFYFNQLEV